MHKTIKSHFPFLLFSLIAAAGIVAHFDEGAPRTQETIVAPNDSLIVSSELARDQVKILTDVIVQYEVNWGQLNAAREDLRMQTRGFYAVIFVGLLSAALIVERGRKHIGDITIVVAVLMYVIDVHTFDIIKRQESDCIKLQNSMAELTSLPPDNTTFYRLEFPQPSISSTGSWLERVKTITLPRLLGKLIRAFTPSFEQIGIYFVPILLLLASRKKLNV